ncbi:endo-1,4-beta xylanase [Cladochytrium replicatum]|nr:endo-1,4-beta xylanase [Cladochytrium replicatum]
MVALASIALALLAVFHSHVSAQNLKDLANAKGRYFGGAFDLIEISNNANVNLLKQHVSMTTPENAMKWDATEPNPNQFVFGNADKTVAFAKANGIVVRGHTLVWHSQLPSWVTGGKWNNQTLTAAMTNHITKVMTHFKGQLVHWDVCNEIFNDDGTLRTSVFSQFIGEAFVSIAFRTARQVDPSVKLFINDFNLDSTNAKSAAMVNLVRRLRSQGVPIDGIGSQAHLIVGGISPTFKQALNNFAALGVQVALTELDIRMTLPASTAKLQQQQKDYQAVVSACMTIANCVGVEIWSMSDKFSWIPGVFQGQGAALPFDENFQKKAAFTGIVSALNGASTKAAFPNVGVKAAAGNNLIAQKTVTKTVKKTTTRTRTKTRAGAIQIGHP